ncbi:MAG: MFS transporter [Caulobacteraceae bacterium]
MTASRAARSSLAALLRRAPPKAGADEGDISSRSLAVYALPSISLAFLVLPVVYFLPPFYASSLHVDLAAIGGFLLASRGLDVFLDPMIGRWSDSTRSRHGRRKIWILAGTPILMIGAYILFMPPVAPNGWYLLMASFVIYAGGSILGLPYSAWGTEIAETYHGRSRMAGFRTLFGVLGGLLAAGVSSLTVFFGHPGVNRFSMAIFGWMIIALTPITVAIAVLRVPEPCVEDAQPQASWLRSMKEILANGPFRVLCGAFILFSIGGSVVAATMVFYLSDFLKQPEVVGPSFLVLQLSIVVAVPLWLWASRRIGKHRATSFSLLASIAIFALWAPFLRAGDGWWFVLMVAVLGVVSAGYQTLPIGIIGDVIDYDALKHGLPRGGIYWGVWSFAQKVAPALGIGVTLPALQFMGFRPGAHNSPGALIALRDTFCFAVIPFFSAGSVLLLGFPINDRRHALIRLRLAAREARRASGEVASPSPGVEPGNPLAGSLR